MSQFSWGFCVWNVLTGGVGNWRVSVQELSQWLWDVGQDSGRRPAATAARSRLLDGLLQLCLPMVRRLHVHVVQQDLELVSPTQLDMSWALLHLLVGCIRFCRMYKLHFNQSITIVRPDIYGWWVWFLSLLIAAILNCANVCQWLTDWLTGRHYKWCFFVKWCLSKCNRVEFETSHVGGKLIPAVFLTEIFFQEINRNWWIWLSSSSYW